MTATQFSVRYEGPAVTENAIDAAVFGSSLVALAELIQESGEAVHPDGPRYRVRVRSTGGGSFQVFMEMAVWDGIRNLLTGRDADAIATLITIFGSSGLLGLVLWLRGRRPDEVEDVGDQTRFRVDEEERTVERSVGNLYRSKKVRKSFSAFVQPVTRDTVSELKVNIPTSDEVVITPDDRPALVVPPDDDPVTEHTATLMLTIAATWWNSTRWGFREPTIGLLWATIEDEAFLRRVQDRREEFRQGDILECVVRIRQWDLGPGEGIRNDYAILSVLRHLPGDAGTQTSSDDVLQ